MIIMKLYMYGINLNRHHLDEFLHLLELWVLYQYNQHIDVNIYGVFADIVVVLVPALADFAKHSATTLTNPSVAPNPFAKEIRAGLIYVKYSKVFDIVWDKEQLMEIENRIITVIKKAKEENAFLPRINKLCPWCEYKELCPEKDKIEEKYKEIDEVNW